MLRVFTCWSWFVSSIILNITPPVHLLFNRMVLPNLIILLSGKRKCGKDYVGELILNQWERHHQVQHNEFLYCTHSRSINSRIETGNGEIIRISKPIKEHWSKIKSLDLNELLGDGPYKENYRKEMIEWSDQIRSENPSFFCAEAFKTSPFTEYSEYCSLNLTIMKLCSHKANCNCLRHPTKDRHCLFCVVKHSTDNCTNFDTRQCTHITWMETSKWHRWRCFRMRFRWLRQMGLWIGEWCGIDFGYFSDNDENLEFYLNYIGITKY